MSNTDFTNLTRKQLMKHFELERQEWLEVGMSEADIFRVHFGETYENGRGGDYRIWLDERKHSRRNPISLESAKYDGEWFSDGSDFLTDMIRAEKIIRLHIALSQLTTEQQALISRIYFKKEKVIDIAAEQGVSHSAISHRVATVLKKMKKLLN